MQWVNFTRRNVAFVFFAWEFSRGKVRIKFSPTAATSFRAIFPIAKTKRPLFVFHGHSAHGGLIKFCLELAAAFRARKFYFPRTTPAPQ